MVEGAAGIRRMLIVAIILDLTFWIAWFLEPCLVTDVHTEAFIQYENAFPLGHAVVLAWIIQTYFVLGSSNSASAMIWLPAAAGAKGYITAVDILYNLQHDLYETLVPYVVLRLTINILTFGFAFIGLRWAWVKRHALIDPRPLNDYPYHRVASSPPDTTKTRSQA